MTRLIPPFTLAALLTACFAAAPPSGPSGAAAQSLVVAREQFRSPAIQVLESMPPQFVLRFDVEMPTPGYRVETDGVDVDPAAGRIRARLTLTPPEGMVVQMIDQRKIDVRLGTVPPGRFVVELWTRRAADDEHTLVQAFVVIAK